MREIADAMAIRSASLYNHFGSKEEILYAICLRVMDGFPQLLVRWHGYRGTRVRCVGIARA